MSSRKKYKVRIYITENVTGNVVNMLTRLGILRLQNTFDGVNGILAIYDVVCVSGVIPELVNMGIRYFPLDHYEDFVITCPECGQVIEDDMILKVYDENLLSGNNICCPDCGTQMADIVFRPE